MYIYVYICIYIYVYINAFRPHPREIVKMSYDTIRIFDLSKVSAFI